jgi:hypothetical protein
MATWPTYAQLLLADFGVERDTALARTDMESGPPKQMRTKSRVMASIPARVRIDGKTNYQAFLTWWRDTIDYGADWFDFTDPVAGTTLQARIVGGKLGRAVPITGRPGASGTLWEIPLTLEYWDA